MPIIKRVFVSYVNILGRLHSLHYSSLFKSFDDGLFLLFKTFTHFNSHLACSGFRSLNFRETLRFPADFSFVS